MEKRYKYLGDGDTVELGDEWILSYSGKYALISSDGYRFHFSINKNFKNLKEYQKIAWRLRREIKKRRVG